MMQEQDEPPFQNIWRQQGVPWISNKFSAQPAGDPALTSPVAHVLSFHCNHTY